MGEQHRLDPVYRELTAQLPAESVVDSASTAGLWARVTATSAGTTSIGIAFAGGPDLRPWDAAMATADSAAASDAHPGEELAGRKLRDVANDLLGSNDPAERALGLAAVNAHYSSPAVAKANGFVPTGGSQPGERAEWSQVFEPFREFIAGKTVAVIGHHPAAPSALDSSSDFHMLEVPTAVGELPAAAEFIVPRCDVVFISGSAFINGSAPRLLELAADAWCAVIGPSAPLAPVLFERGVDLVAGIVAEDARGMDRDLVAAPYPTMFTHGHRVHRAQPAGASVLD